MPGPRRAAPPPGQLELLAETIQHAEQSTPYYAQAFAGLRTGITCLNDLRGLPLLRRETLVSRWPDFLARGQVPVAVGMTGGTTASQGPLLFFKAMDEVVAKEGLYATLQGQADIRPLVVHLVNLAHGLDPGGARPGCFQLPLERPHHFEAALRVLRHDFGLPGYTPRVQAIAGALRLLRALTMLCLERDLDGREFDIGLLSTSSDQLTSRWRALFEDYWGAAVDETYGLSEVPGLHARRCAECSHFHFAPLAVTEVLRLDADEPVEAGPGRLIATSLYPLAVMQPIIRYDTGDAVDLVGTCPTTGVLAFEFLGRLSQLVIAPGPAGPQVLLSPTAVNEVLDASPEVARGQLTFARNLGLRGNIGFPKWSLVSAPAAGRLRAELRAELCWSPRQFPAAGARLRERLTAQITAAAPALAGAIATGQVEFQVTLLEPNTAPL